MLQVVVLPVGCRNGAEGHLGADVRTLSPACMPRTGVILSCATGDLGRSLSSSNAAWSLANAVHLPPPMIRVAAQGGRPREDSGPGRIGAAQCGAHCGFKGKAAQVIETTRFNGGVFEGRSMLISADPDTASRQRRAERRLLPPAAPQMAELSCQLCRSSILQLCVRGSRAGRMKRASVTRPFQFRSPVRSLAASLLLLAGVLIVTDGLHGLSAPRRPWGLRGRFADTVAVAAEEQQHWEQQTAAAVLAAPATEQPTEEQKQGQQLTLAGLPAEHLAAFSGQQAVPPPPLPPPHQQEEQQQQAEEQQQEEPQHAAQHTQQQEQRQLEAQQDEQRQEVQQQQQSAPTTAEPPPRGQDDATLAFCIAVKGALPCAAMHLADVFDISSPFSPLFLDWLLLLACGCTRCITCFPSPCSCRRALRHSGVGAAPRPAGCRQAGCRKFSLRGRVEGEMAGLQAVEAAVSGVQHRVRSGVFARIAPGGRGRGAATSAGAGAVPGSQRLGAVAQHIISVAALLLHCRQVLRV